MSSTIGLTIDALTSVGSLSGAAELPVWQDGATKKTTVEAISASTPKVLVPSGFAPGPFGANQIIFNWGLSVSGTFLENMPGGILTCDTILDQTAVVTYSYGGTISSGALIGATVIGTGTLSPGGLGTITTSGVTTPDTTNLTMTGPATSVSTLQNITATITGMRTS